MLTLAIDLTTENLLMILIFLALMVLGISGCDRGQHISIHSVRTAACLEVKK
jgi:hypothetical protein